MVSELSDLLMMDQEEPFDNSLFYGPSESVKPGDAIKLLERKAGEGAEFVPFKDVMAAMGADTGRVDLFSLPFLGLGFLAPVSEKTGKMLHGATEYLPREDLIPLDRGYGEITQVANIFSLQDRFHGKGIGEDFKVYEFHENMFGAHKKIENRHGTVDFKYWVKVDPATRKVTDFRIQYEVESRAGKSYLTVSVGLESGEYVPSARIIDAGYGRGKTELQFDENGVAPNGRSDFNNTAKFKKDDLIGILRFANDDISMAELTAMNLLHKSMGYEPGLKIDYVATLKAMAAATPMFSQRMGDVQGYKLLQLKN